MIINKNFFYFLICCSFLSFIFGYHMQENSAGGGPNDYNHIATNYNLIFSNNFTEISWDKYDSSRFPLHYFITKIYLPLDFGIIRLNNFILSLIIPIILIFSFKKKLNYTKEFNYFFLISISFLIYLSPYFRTTAYWMLEENFGIFFLIISSYFLFSALYNPKKKILNIILNLLFIYFAFFCSQNLFVFIIINFFILINYFWKNLFYIFFVCLLNSIFLFFPLLIFYDLFTSLFNNISSARVDFNVDNIVDFFSILLVYLLPVSIICFNKNDFLNFYKKYYKSIIIFFGLYLSLFWGHDSVALGGGAIKKLLLFMFNKSFFYKFFFISSSFIGILLSIQIIKDKDPKLTFFIIPYLIFILFSDYVFQEYLDPLFLIYIILFTNFLDSLREKQIFFLYFYFFLFLISANIYYLI